MLFPHIFHTVSNFHKISTLFPNYFYSISNFHLISMLFPHYFQLPSHFHPISIPLKVVFTTDGTCYNSGLFKLSVEIVYFIYHYNCKTQKCEYVSIAIRYMSIYIFNDLLKVHVVALTMCSGRLFHSSTTSVKKLYL